MSLVLPKFKFLLLRISVIGAVFLAGNLLARSTNNLSEGPILCTFRLVTDLPCPLCGTTRAFGSLSQGNFGESLNLNPLALVIAVIVSAWLLNPQFIQKSSDHFVQFWWRINERGRLICSILIFTFFWVANIPRMLNA